MLRLIYYEIRKNYFRRYVLIAALLFICLNAGVIYRNYLIGDGLMGYFMPHSKETQVKWSFYSDMHEKLDGAITSDRARLVIDEYHRLNALVADGSYSRDYQPDTYTGYVWGDYAMFTKYFYEPMKYAVGYEADLTEVVEKARNNISFYSEYNNSYEISKNQYIVQHYNGRQINVFFDGKPWELLFNYRFSDLLILLLMLLGLIPMYIQEKENHMDQLILSCRKGKGNMALAKVLAMVFFVAFLLFVFSITNFLVIKTLYGLSGEGMPLYAIKAYQYTPVNLSVLDFYALLVLYKLEGFVVIGLWLALLSVLFKRILYPYLLGVLLNVSGLFASGYLASVETKKALWAFESPFTLLKGNELFTGLLGISIGNTFILRASLCMIVQFVIALGLYILIRRLSTFRCLTISRLPSVKAGD